MPVRSSLCTYSPAAAASGRSSALGSSKYSSVFTSPSSYGHYKQITSSLRSYPSPTPSSSGSIQTEGRFGHHSTGTSASYPSTSSASASSYSPGSGSVGLYKPLSSMRRYPSSGNQPARPFSSTSSPSTSSLTSTSSTLSSGSSGVDHVGSNGVGSNCGYQPYKSTSSLSTSAYSSGSSLSSSPSSSSSSSSSSAGSAHYSSPYSSLRQSRFLSSRAAASAASSGATPGGRGEKLPADAPCGLTNLGNTCYMNASLQALYSLESFRSLIKSAAQRSRGGERPLTRELAELFVQMKESAETGQPLSPADFKFAFARHQSKFAGFGQQDAQEFLRYLIDGIHEESNAARRKSRQRHSGSTAPRTADEAWLQYRDIVDDSPLVDLLVGQLCSTITCCECHNKSHCWDPFWDLSLPLSSRSGARGANGGGSFLPSSGSTSSAGSIGSWRSVGSLGSSGSGGAGRLSRLSGIIEEFTTKETLDADERPHCSHCKRPTRSTKQISLARLPRVLILHLKKFTNDGYKLTSPELQIDKHLTFDGHHYQLRACISHHGHSSSSGHYTSHCEYSARWLHFDDSRVRDVTQTFDCNKLDDAYVLFYTQQQRQAGPLASSARRSSRSSPPPLPPGDVTSQSKL